MKKTTIKKAICAGAVSVSCIVTLAGCRKATFASYNVSKEADNFNVLRKITVVNTRSDSILYELTGFFSLLPLSQESVRTITAPMVVPEVEE